MRAGFLLALGPCLASCAAFAPPEPPPRPPVDGIERAEWHLHLNARGRGIGSYTLVLKFDPEVASIEDIRSCGVRHFKGAPQFDPRTFHSGLTRVTAFDTFPSNPPDGDYHLLTITFRRRAAGALVAAAEIEKLYDDFDKPLRGSITQPRFEHAFP